MDIQYIISSIREKSNSLSDHVVHTQMFPYYVAVHYILVTLALRARPGAREFAANYPITSCCVCVTACNGGKILMNFLLGESLLQAFENSSNVMLALATWYLIMFSPFDIIYSLLQVKAIKACILVLKEVHRVRQVQHGVVVALTMHGGNWIQGIILGCVCSSGATFLLRPLDHFSRGEVISGHELLSPNFSTKTSVATSILLVLRIGGYIQLSEQLLMFCIVACAAFFQLLFLLTKTPDPTKYMERAICSVLFKVPEQSAKAKDSGRKQKAD